MSRFLVYALHIPESSRLYIGRSTKGLRRPRAHRLPAILKARAHVPLTRWILKYRALGYEYQIVVLEECASFDESTEAEIFYIAYFRSLGFSLLNCTEGGEGLLNPSSEVREKISKARKGKKASLETRSRMSAAARNRSPEHREKLVLAARNRSPEFKAKLLAASHRPDARKKRGLAHRGKVMSAEAREKISIANRNLTPEARAKMSESHRGRKLSRETRAKISIASKRYTRKHREENVERLKKARAARKPFTEERRRDISRQFLGKPKSEEHRRKLAVALARGRETMRLQRLSRVPRLRINLLRDES